jgi:hypothetical protein
LEPHSGQNFARPTGAPQSRQETARSSRSAFDAVACWYAASRTAAIFASRRTAESSASRRGTQEMHTPSSSFQQLSHMFCEQRGQRWKWSDAFCTAERRALSFADE